MGGWIGRLRIQRGIAMVGLHFDATKTAEKSTGEVKEASRKLAA